MSENILTEVIKKAGGASALATDLGITKQSIYQWIGKGHIPASRHYEIHTKYGISLVDLAKSTSKSRDS